MGNHSTSPEPFTRLTRAEEEVMQILWRAGKGLVNDLLDHFPEPRPAYNTVSTILRILEQKGFVDHKAYGRTHEYFPLVSKADYTRASLRNLLSNYFGNSYHTLASFFATDGNLSLRELEEIQRAIDNEIKKQREEKR